MRETYKQIDLPEGLTLDACPVCGTDPALWQFCESEGGPATKVVMCCNGEPIGPQEKDGGLVFAGCLLFMPPDDFYRGRIVEAVNYWNDYAKAMAALREKNRGYRAGVAMDELAQARAALRLCHEHFAREIADDATMVASDFGEAYRATVECLGLKEV